MHWNNTEQHINNFGSNVTIEEKQHITHVVKCLVWAVVSGHKKAAICPENWDKLCNNLWSLNKCGMAFSHLIKVDSFAWETYLVFCILKGPHIRTFV